MAAQYKRDFKVGRQSELLYNEELHRIFEAIRHLNDEVGENSTPPKAKVDGALWLDPRTNELKRYVRNTDEWVVVFEKKFQIIDQLVSFMPPDNPVKGQLWLNNGVLMYFDGQDWTPVKSMSQDAGQFDTSLFNNHLFISPLLRTGHTVIGDNDMKRYYEDVMLHGKDTKKLDKENNSDYLSDGTKWDFGHKCDEKAAKFSDIKMQSQFLVPNVNTARVFVDDKLDFSYQRMSQVCIQYDKDFIENKTPSTIHINPGRLNDVRKRLFKVDKVSGKIYFRGDSFELYGYTYGEPTGHLLLPEAEPDDGGYIKTSDGVTLSYHQAQGYDLVLVVTYDFGWLKTSGQALHVNTNQTNSTYYIDNFMSPHNIFVNGYNLEETAFKADPLTKTITLPKEAQDLSVSGFHTRLREFGFVRDVDMQGRGILKTLHEYKRPLVFINGEALCETDGITKEKNLIHVPGARANMVWAIAEMQGDEKDPDFCMYVKNGCGVVPDNGYISYDVEDALYDDDLILFIDGIMVQPEDLVIDRNAGSITVEGLRPGQEYILLKDRYNRLYHDTALIPALNVGRFQESLVYYNGYLICNDTAINETRSTFDAEGFNNEIKFFINDENHQRPTGEFRIYKERIDPGPNKEKGEWIKLSEDVEEQNKIIKGVQSICYSYENTASSIKLNTKWLKKYGIDFNAKKDAVDVYAFKYANYTEDPVRINNIVVTGPNQYTEDLKTFVTNDYFKPGRNLLQVYINGVRQFHVTELGEGNGFKFDAPVTPPCMISYIILQDKENIPNYVKRVLMNHENMLPGVTNVYKTYKVKRANKKEDHVALFPGRVVCYVNGVRQPRDTYTILDNYTIMFNDINTKLIGSEQNFPTEIIMDENGQIKLDEKGNPMKIEHASSDEILLEIFQDFNRTEDSTKIASNIASFEINVEDHNIPLPILESTDEVLIYIDGLFLGLRANDGSEYSYDRNTKRGVITINSGHILNRILSDPIYEYLVQHPEKMIEYQNTHNGKEYKPKPKNLTLEWRNM